jgi:hypothetical protein
LTQTISQNCTHGHEEKRQRIARPSRNLLLEGSQMSFQIDLHLTPRGGDGGGHFRLRSCRIRAFLQTDQRRKVELADATQFCPVEPHRLEDFRVLRETIQGANSLSGRKAEVRAQYPDHDMRLTIDADRFSDHSGIGPKPPAP